MFIQSANNTHLSKRILRRIYRVCRKIAGKVYRGCRKIGGKVYRFCRKIAGKICRKIYHTLKKIYLFCKTIYRKIRNKFDAIMKDVLLRLRKIILHIKEEKYNVISLKEWCTINNLFYRVMETNRSVTIHPPKIISVDGTRTLAQAEGKLPEVFLAKLNKVTVIEGTDMVIVNQNTVLYDEMALDIEGKYEERNNLSRLIFHRQHNPKKIGIQYQKNSTKKLPNTAIHFCKDYSFNFFHWLVEGLPRLSVIEKFPELDGLPLLIDAKLKPQQLEALQLITEGKREIITLGFGQSYHIKNLIYPSCLSHVHNNYYHPVDYTHDIVISPHAIEYLRKKFLPLAKNPGLKNKFYISRRNLGENSSRRLLNDDEIEDFLSQHGFMIVYPEKMSFIEQVTLFSEAKLIIGASGSAFSSIMFSPPGCQVYVLSANNEQVNFNLFSTLANIAQLKFNYVLGEDYGISYLTKTHSTFRVSTKLLAAILENEHEAPRQVQPAYENVFRLNTAEI